MADNQCTHRAENEACHKSCLSVWLRKKNLYKKIANVYLTVTILNVVSGIAGLLIVCGIEYIYNKSYNKRNIEQQRSRGELFNGISGDSKRIFVSSAFGCRYQCQYCYLREMKVNGIKKQFTVHELIKEIKKQDKFIPGKFGTIVSIGCYSECLSPENRKTTIEMIKFFLKQGNYIQLSTKMKVCENDVVELLQDIQYEDQLNIFVSMATVGKSDEIEHGVDPVSVRIKTLMLKDKYPCNTYLYIKPVIPGVTIKDLEKYISIIKKYKVAVVIGEKLRVAHDNSDKEIKIGNTWMKRDVCDDEDKLVEILQKYTRIFRHSIEPIEVIRKNDMF